MPSTVLGAYKHSQEQDKFSQHLLAGISVIKQDAMEVSIPFHHFPYFTFRCEHSASSFPGAL